MKLLLGRATFSKSAEGVSKGFKIPASALDLRSDLEKLNRVPDLSREALLVLRHHLRSLQSFEAAGRTGSVTLAARELGVSASAVTQQIRGLEQALGLPLLERHGNGVVLTPLGRLYHAEVSQGFRKLEAAQDLLARARRQSEIVISCLPSVASKWLSRQLFDWQARHPQARVHLVSTEVEPTFGRDRADFRITYGQAARGYDHYSDLFTDWMVPACAPAFLAGHPAAEPADVLGQALLRIDWDLGAGALPGWHDWARLIGAVAPESGGQLTFSLSSSAIDAAVDGRGFVLGQMSMIAAEVEAGRLVVPHDVRLPLPGAYVFAWDRAALRKPFAPEFRAWIGEIARRQARSSKPADPPGAETVRR